MVLGRYRSVLIDTGSYLVSRERHWLIYDGTGSVVLGVTRSVDGVTG